MTRLYHLEIIFYDSWKWGVVVRCIVRAYSEYHKRVILEWRLFLRARTIMSVLIQAYCLSIFNVMSVYLSY